MQSNFERSIDTDEAIERALSWASINGLDVFFRSTGSKIVTTECSLRKNGEREYIGRGKGLGRQTSASAIFEAVEHYYYDTESLNIVSSRFSPNAPSWRGAFEGSSPNFSLFNKGQILPLSCLEFIAVAEEWRIEFPAILTHPKFLAPNLAEGLFIEESGIYKYSSNSGTAAGISNNDALLHSLLELIERDALGLALVESTVRPSPKPMRRYLPASFSLDLRDIFAAIERETGGELTIWDITSDLGVPSALARVRVGGRDFFGSGASLSQGYAIRRAALESVQVFQIQCAFGPWLQLDRPLDPARMSLYQRCNLQGGIFMFRGGEICVDYCDDSFSVSTSIDDQIIYLERALTRMGIEVFYRQIYSSEVTVVQAVAPKLERFHLVTHGLPVAPGGRAKMVERSI